MGTLCLLKFRYLIPFKINKSTGNSDSIRIYFGIILTNLIEVTSTVQCEQYFAIEEVMRSHSRNGNKRV